LFPVPFKPFERRTSMKLALVICSLAEGGAERVMSRMANHWSHEGVDVSIVTLDSANSDVYPLNRQVHRVALDVYKDSRTPIEALVNNLHRVLHLRGALRVICPEAVICFMEATNVLTILATRGLNVKVVVMEHTNPESHQVGWFWNTLRRMTYRFADRVGVLTERSRPWAERLTDPASVFVLPNAIDIASATGTEVVELRAFVGLPEQAQVVVSMGRLAPEKGFDLLIQAFTQLAPSHPDFHLVILGEGADRSALEQARERSGQAGRIHLPGRVSNPMMYLRQCDLFVMSSRYEGFPMALCEAMACGLPVISFDCPTGPGEIIRNNVDGILVAAGNVRELTETMHRLMSDPAARRTLGTRGPEVLERFSEDRIMGEWNRILAELTSD
jgi:GalNAc-alpha-(1->4)-GalNAc-alpha-(1->3)-diNAcBac-PP-undecaprenol alpha-1,4-N-acetyl-D-galactosaminyltransferase